MSTVQHSCLHVQIDVQHRGENFGNSELHSGATNIATDHAHAPVILDTAHENIESSDCVHLGASYGDMERIEMAMTGSNVRRGVSINISAIHRGSLLDEVLGLELEVFRGSHVQTRPQLCVDRCSGCANIVDEDKIKNY